MSHERFRNPPIIEAVAALRFAVAEPWSNDLRRRIANRLRPLYPGEERQEVQLEFQTRVAGLETSTTTRSAPARLLLLTEDGTGLAGIGPGVISVHVLKPYPGWAEFEARVQAAVAAVQEETEANALLEVAIRYIDRIALSEGEGLSLTEYFTAIPPRPDDMPRQLTAYQLITEAQDPDTGTIAVLTTSAVPPGKGESFVMLYDLNLLRRYQPEKPLPVGDFLAVLNALHDQQYRIFMDSITPKTKELFA